MSSRSAPPLCKIPVEKHGDQSRAWCLCKDGADVWRWAWTHYGTGRFEKKRRPSKRFVFRSCPDIEEPYLHGRHLWFSPDSVHSVQQVKRLTTELDEVLLKGGFQDKGWLSNQSLENEIIRQDKPEMKLLQGSTQEKILGTVWNHAKHVLLLNVNPPNDIILTKRTVLSQIARILIRAGFAAAFLVHVKIEMQRLWQQGLNWDQELSSPAREEWVRFFQKMGDLNHVTCERSFALAWTRLQCQYSVWDCWNLVWYILQHR